jgi:hypothetical protein
MHNATLAEYDRQAALVSYQAKRSAVGATDADTPEAAPSPDQAASSPEIQEATAETEPARIDKSVLAFPELRCHRDKTHLRFVGSPAMPTICALRKPEVSASRSATNSPCDSAVDIIANCIAPVTKAFGGAQSVSTRWLPRGRFGLRCTRFEPRPKQPAQRP